MFDGAAWGKVRLEAVELLRESEDTTRRNFGVGGAVEGSVKSQKTSSVASAPHNSGIMADLKSRDAGDSVR